MPLEVQHFGFQLLQHLVRSLVPFLTSDASPRLERTCPLVEKQPRISAPCNSTLDILLATAGCLALQHLALQVTYRWGELSAAEREQLARGSQTLLVNTGNTPLTWAVRSKAALLVALVTKRMGQPFWETMLPELVAYAGQGPVQAEKVPSANLSLLL